VTARNSVGDSLESDPISIRAARRPDAPINLANVAVITTAYQIGLTWADGIYDGGSPVLDYRVNYKTQDDSSFTVYQDSLLATDLTVTGLTPGVYYNFKVESRNLVNYSPYSDEIIVLAAQIPDQPTNLANVPANTLATQIGLEWLAPVFNGGSAILDYKVWYDNASSGVTFTEFVSGLTDLNYIATGLTQGQTY
jgi:hypothetical protein